MANMHYLKREKQGKLIQLFAVCRSDDEFGFITRTTKYAIDEQYKKEISYLAYPLPHEELTEISFEEFKELSRKHNLLTAGNIPNPKLSSDRDTSASNHSP